MSLPQGEPLHAVNPWFSFYPHSVAATNRIPDTCAALSVFSCYLFICCKIRELAGRGQVSIGAELSVAVGPVGRTGAGNVSVAAEGVAHAYSCEHRI